MSTGRVGVVGASARGAVPSLARAGMTAWAVDLFADRDLARLASCVVCPADRFPGDIPPLAAAFPPGPFLYTGGLESHPDILAELAATRELLGTQPTSLATVRDPRQIAGWLSREGFAHARVIAMGEPCPADGRWLCKPLRSSGGHGIRFARPGEAPSPTHYLQEFVPGPPMSAVFRDGTLMGITEQLIGTAWLHAQGFQYAGNIAISDVPAALHTELTSLGARLATAFDLRGVVGVDFILNERRPWVNEVNPRYPASAEVVEHLTGRAVFAGSLPDWPGMGLRAGAVGKAIYYAARDIEFPPEGPWDCDLEGPFEPWRVPGFADIPSPGSVIPNGWPVLTIFAQGSSPTECRERLQSRAMELDHLFQGTSP